MRRDDLALARLTLQMVTQYIVSSRAGFWRLFPDQHDDDFERMISPEAYTYVQRNDRTRQSKGYFRYNCWLCKRLTYLLVAPKIYLLRKLAGLKW